MKGKFPKQDEVYQSFIYKRTYARWEPFPDIKRREEWSESVDRYFDFFKRKARFLHSQKPNSTAEGLDLILNKYMAAAYQQLLNKGAMPSMRAFWTAGKALEADNIAGYNCAAINIDDPKAFSECLYVLMNGAGVGFSVERQVICNLPSIPELKDSEGTIVFEDSKLGWAEGYHAFITALYEGSIKKYDLSKIRKKGERLKTFGGRASGPEPLEALLKYTLSKFKEAQGRKLRSLECHDICCKIAECVVVGGVRRSAMISLSNPSDDRMRDAKDGEFWLSQPQRALANNSAVYTEKPDCIQFMKSWLALAKSGSGERGIINREAFIKKAIKNKREIYAFIPNPCGEVILRPMQFCNLAEIVVRQSDTLEDLKEKAKAAVVFAVLQSTLTDFKFLREDWKRNCEEERLCGVSITGALDHPALGNVKDKESILKWLNVLRATVETTGSHFASLLGVAVPKTFTTIKPSGTVSQLTGTSSGLHSRWSKFYIRRVQVATTDPICKMLKDQGVPCEPYLGQSEEDATTLVFSFPMKSPDTAVVRSDLTAKDQLDLWSVYNEGWCDHNPSCTIYIKDHEWLEVGNWVFQNWDSIGGLSFLPDNGGVYKQAPFEEITEDEYIKLSSEFPDVDFTQLTKYEKEDNSLGSREFACVGGACEI